MGSWGPVNSTLRLFRSFLINGAMMVVLKQHSKNPAKIPE
jgi:hypothetical protein